LRLRAKGAETPAARDRERCGDATQPEVRRGLGSATEPHGRQRPSRPQGGAGSETVEEVENLVDGSCREGNSREIRIRTLTSSKGKRTPGGEVLAVRPGPGTRKSALGGTQACGSGSGPSGPGQTGRRNTSWPITTARRGRRTRRAATSYGRVLREAEEPCEGGLDGGDDRPGAPRLPKPLEGRSATCPTDCRPHVSRFACRRPPCERRSEPSPVLGAVDAKGRTRQEGAKRKRSAGIMGTP
jgi:hypothetical protein